jgi:hypothetical protein
MSLALTQVAKAALRAPGDPLDVLLVRTAEPFDAALCRAGPGHRFWAVTHPALRPWVAETLAPPANLVLLPDGQLPPDVAFDVMVAPHRPALAEFSARLAAVLSLPLVSLFVDPPPANPAIRDALRERAGSLRVYPGREAAGDWAETGEARYVPAWNASRLAKVLEGVVGV